MPKPSDYQERLKLISNIAKLGINSKKFKAKNPNFTRSEKIRITRYYNFAKESGFFGKEGDKFIPKIKLVKSPKKKQKGFPAFGGYFLQGAAPTDKVKNGKIIKDNFEKIFIEMDFNTAYDEIIEEWIEAKNEGTRPNEFEGDISIETITQEIADKIAPYYDELVRGDYFTIVLQNGWEIGRGQRKDWKSKRGQPIAEDLEGEEKINNLVQKINELLSRAISKYESEVTLVSGIYLYKFTNQRKPNNEERKIINGKRKKKKARKN